MEAYQTRVVEEKTALDAKLNLLIRFLDGSATYQLLDKAEQKRLGRQCEAMETYSIVLAERIENFKN